MNLEDVDFETLEGGQQQIEHDDFPPIEEIDGIQGQPTGTGTGTGTGVSPEGGNPPAGTQPQDVLTSFLKYQGISDPEHIKFEDEDGIVKERSWNDLSFEEKMNIMTTSSEEPERDLTEDEIKFINELRTSKLTPEQYINTIRQKAAQDYQESLSNAPQYSIDDLSDDEIFMLDLQDKIEDISDEDLKAALEKAKEDPLFARRIAGTRKALKEQEEQYKQQLAAEQEQVQEEQFNQFKDSVLKSIQSFNKVGDLDLNLETEDMEDIASFILDRDDSGMSYFGKALNDPKTLVEMAWWTLKGRDALNSISEYFVNEIKNVRQMSYQKGLEDGKKGSSKVVYRSQGQPAQNGNRPLSINDIYG